MKISCPSCSAKYSIADEKVQNRLAKIRCRKCGTSIVIDGNVSPAHVYAADGADAGAAAPAAAPAAAAPAAGAMYSVDLGENDQRQMSVADIVAAYNEGAVTADTYVWTDGFADWTPLAQVEDLVAALHAAAQGAPIAPADEVSAAMASTEPEENPWDSSGHQAAPAASPAAPAGGVDLFGGVAAAGAESQQRAASPSPGPSPFDGGGGAAATGARNESSVLFSLSALTSGASQSRPSVPAPTASTATNNDDSGLIDLKALTASAEAMAHAPAAVAPIQSPLVSPSPLGGAPLGGSPLAMGAGPSINPQAQKGSNTGLIIGGFLFAAIVAVALIFQFGGSEEEPEIAPPAPATEATPAPTAAAPEPVPTAKTEELPTADAKPPSTGTEEDEAAPTKPTTARPTPRPSSGPKPSSSPSPAASPSPAPAPKPAPSVGKCGCKKDDLMCLMNCAQ